MEQLQQAEDGTRRLWCRCISRVACDMEASVRLQKLWFTVLEDGHAVGGLYQGKPVGVKYSAITVFSFHPVKIITTGEGGLATTIRRLIAWQST